MYRFSFILLICPSLTLFFAYVRTGLATRSRCPWSYEGKREGGRRQRTARVAAVGWALRAPSSSGLQGATLAAVPRDPLSMRLDDKAADAVYICSPDHLHHTHAIASGVDSGAVMAELFAKARQFHEDLSDWDVSHVTTMDG